MQLYAAKDTSIRAPALLEKSHGSGLLKTGDAAPILHRIKCMLSDECMQNRNVPQVW
jgi:hypothetical protein